MPYGERINPYVALFIRALDDRQRQGQAERAELLALARDPSKTGYSLEPVAQPPKSAGLFGRLGGHRYADPNIVEVGGQPFRVNYSAPEGPVTLGDLAAAGQLQGVPESMKNQPATEQLVDMFSRVQVQPENARSSALEALGTIQGMREREGAGPVTDKRIAHAERATISNPPPPVLRLPPEQTATILEGRTERRSEAEADRRKAETEAAERNRRFGLDEQRLGLDEQRFGLSQQAETRAQRDQRLQEQKFPAEQKETQARIAKLQSEIEKNKREAAGVMSRPDQIDLQRKVRGDIRQEPVYKDYENALNGYQSVSVGAQRGDGQGDLAIVNGIVRLLDPGSVNRPSEVAAAMNAQGWLEWAKTWQSRWKQGDSLGPESRQKFLSMAEDLYESYSNRATGLVGQVYGSVLQDTGLTLDDVFVEPGGPKQPPETPGTPEASEGKGFLKELAEGVGEVIGRQEKPAQPPAGSQTLTEEDIAVTMQSSGRSREEVIQAARKKGYRIPGSTP